MADILTSVGLDVGTTSTQLVVSRLTVENRASGFSVPELQIAERDVYYRSAVHFTPLLETGLIDGQGLRQLVTEEYRRAGISRERVDTGAVIVTGETSRRENARIVAESLAELAGDFVVATAGPDLESVLAAKGAGAVQWSRSTGKRVLHMDIGGGTSNLALIEDGEIRRTGCLNVGGRLVKVDDRGVVTCVSPVVSGVADIRVGEAVPAEKLENLGEILVQALEEAAGLRPATAVLEKLATREAVSPWIPPSESCVISFSGGVADCVETEHPSFAFGDMGPILGRAIRKSALCRGEYRLGSETIRATVIGAGCHSIQLSGSTVYHRNVAFPMKNLPVAVISPKEQAGELGEAIRRSLERQETAAVVSLPGLASPDYGSICAMAEEILRGMAGQPLYVTVGEDMAKALGQALALRAGPQVPILCLDRVKPGPESYLDVGTPVGSAFPVVVKTLVLER